MTDHEEQSESEPGQAEDPLLEEQQGKGYGQDEAERDEALEELNWERGGP